jgi:hypothetical protein
MGDEEGPGIPEIELIIRASTIDGRRKGACLFCQVPLASRVSDPYPDPDWIRIQLGQ